VKDARFDQKDRVILHALKKNARTTLATLSHELRIPRATVHERIAKLERSGIIKRYTIEEDHERTGLPALSFIFVSTETAADPTAISKKMGRLDGVLGIYRISGDWDLLVKLRGKSAEEIGTAVAERIRKIPGVSRICTIPVFETVKDGI